MTYEPHATLLLSDGDIRAVFDWRAAADALRSAYAAVDDSSRYPARSMARGDRVWLRTLSGVATDGRYMGAKLIAASFRRARASYLIPLFDQESADLVGLLDGNAITGFRTAATSALAAVQLANDDALPVVALIGSGFEAAHHLRALAGVKPLGAVRVYSPNPASRERFIRQVADLGLHVTGCNSAPEAIAGASIVICAARSRDESPTLRGAWLEPGMTVISIGSTLPEQREVDPETLARADLIVADMVEEVVHDTGDLIAARAAGVECNGKVIALSDVIAGRHPGRQSREQIVVYKSVGAGIQDLTVAGMCLDRARARGLGTTLPPAIAAVEKGK